MRSTFRPRSCISTTKSAAAESANPISSMAPAPCSWNASASITKGLKPGDRSRIKSAESRGLRVDQCPRRSCPMRPLLHSLHKGGPACCRTAKQTGISLRLARRSARPDVFSIVEPENAISSAPAITAAQAARFASSESAISIFSRMRQPPLERAPRTKGNSPGTESAKRRPARSSAL